MLSTIFLLILCAIVAAVGAPLMLRLIPPNGIYGFPTRKMKSEPHVWTHVNAFAGRALVIAAGVAALLIMYYNGTWLRSGWAQFFVFLVAVAAAVGATVWFAQKTEANPPPKPREE